MARKRRGKQKCTDNGEVDRVLTGQLRPNAEKLIRLIAKVNPTNKILDAPPQRLRYEQKSRLQSMLIDRFGDELEVRRDPHQPNVVLLVHRHLGLDACHVPIDVLETDARMWVQRQLDQTDYDAPDEEPPVTSSRAASDDDDPTDEDGTAAVEPSLGVPELLAHGRAVMDQYDYEAAREFFEAAFTRSGGEEEPATQLLSFLVDHLGMYTEVLEWAESLSGKAAKALPIRVLLGRAAVELGSVKKAEHWIDGLNTPEVAPVLLRLVDHAISAGDWIRADEKLDMARRNGAEPYELVPREKAVADGRAEARAPREDALERLWDEGDIETAGVVARELLEQWPNSRVARTVLRRIENQRRDEKRGAVLTQARVLVDKGNLDEALVLLRQAEDLCTDEASSREVGLRIDRVTSAVDTKIRSHRIRDVVSRLRSQRGHESLVAFLKLSVYDRQQVLEKMPDKGLERVHALFMQSKGTSVDKLVRAELALEGAEARHSSGALVDAQELLAAEWSSLKRFPAAKALRTRIFADQAADREDRVRDAIERLEEALGEHDIDAVTSASKHLQDLSRSGKLDSRGTDLLDQAGSVIKLHTIVERFEKELDDGDFFKAKKTASSLAEIGSGEHKERWQRKAADVQERIQKKWQVDVFERPDSTKPPEGTSDGDKDFDKLAEALSAVACQLTVDFHEMWLLPSTHDIITVASFWRWVYIAVHSHHTGDITKVVVLMAPETIGEDPEVVVDDDTVWIADTDGRLIQVDHRSWEIRRYAHPGALAVGGEALEQVIAQPNSEHIWINWRMPNYDEETSIINLDTNTITRQLTRSALWYLIPGDHPSTATSHDDEFTWAFYDARGRRIERLSSDGRYRIDKACPHPGGEGHVLLTWTPNDPDGDDGGVLGVCLRCPSGELSKRLVLVDSDSDLIHDWAIQTSSPEVICYWTTTERQKWLQAFEIVGDALVSKWKVRASGDLRLVQDCRGEAVVLMVAGQSGLHYYRPGETAPDLPVEARRDLVIPDHRSGRTCGWPQFPGGDIHDALVSLRRLPDDRKPAAVDALVEKRRDDPDKLFELFVILRLVSGVDHDRRLLQAVEWYPRHGALSLMVAQVLADNGNWKAVQDRLLVCKTDDLDPEGKQHKDHLLGLSYFYLDEPEVARRIWEKSISDGSYCNLSGWIEMTAPLSDPLPQADWDEDQSTLTQIRGAIQTADEAMERRDYRGAIAALDRDVVWRVNELQSLARLVKAWLSVEVVTDLERARKVLSLAALTATDLDAEYSRRRNLALASGRWDTGRLRGLIENAQTWLEDETEK